MNLQSFNNYLTDIYEIANTPVFLYKKMRELLFIQELSNLPTGELLHEFDARAKKPISSNKEIAELYGIFIALTFKEPQEVNNFFTKALTIKFEWFSDIAKIYFSDYRPTPTIQSLSIKEEDINIDQYHVSEIDDITIS